MKKDFKFDELFKYRSVWMGIAIIWVIYYHLPHDFITNPLLLKLQLYGYAGVDMFLFASGIGCYYSLSRDANALNFFLRRLKRLLPSYWFFLIMWTAEQLIRNDISLQAVLGNYLGVQYFSSVGISFNWYIALIFFLYVIAPLLFELIKRSETYRELIKYVVLMVLFTIPFIGDQGRLIMYSRVPVFFIGLCFGKAGVNGKAAERKHWISAAIAGVAGTLALYITDNYFYDYIWKSGFAWYPFILITPFMCMCISFVFAQIHRYKAGDAVKRAFSYLGDHSFELFLSHLLLIDIRALFVDKGYLPNVLWTWALVVLLSLPVALFIALVPKVIKNARK